MLPEGCACGSGEFDRIEPYYTHQEIELPQIEMDSLWVFLSHHGVEPTHNRGKRALRFGVQWRKRSLGTASDKGRRWVERILSLKETCRLRAVSTYEVLVDAVRSFFRGQQPDFAWLQ